MGELKAEIKDGNLSGFVRIWPGIIGGFFVSSSILGISAAVGHDSSTTYDPAELVVVDFSPEAGMNCTGLRPEDTEKVIASTITCEDDRP